MTVKKKGEGGRGQEDGAMRRRERGRDGTGRRREKGEEGNVNVYSAIYT